MPRARHCRHAPAWKANFSFNCTGKHARTYTVTSLWDSVGMFTAVSHTSVRVTQDVHRHTHEEGKKIRTQLQHWWPEVRWIVCPARQVPYRCTESRNSRQCPKVVSLNDTTRISIHTCMYVCMYENRQCHGRTRISHTNYIH